MSHFFVLLIFRVMMMVIKVLTKLMILVVIILSIYLHTVELFLESNRTGSWHRCSHPDQHDDHIGDNQDYDRTMMTIVMIKMVKT